MALKDYQCESCQQIQEFDVPVHLPRIEQEKITRKCSGCNRRRKFALIYAATYLTAGMLTKKYTGQSAATKGWGTYDLDYGKAGSDLVAGRAREVAELINGHSLNEGRPTH